MIHSQFCSKWNQWEPTSYLFSVIFTLISLSVVYIHTLKDFYSIDKMSKNLRINQFIVFIENKVGLASGMHCVLWQYYVFVTKFLVVLGVWQDNFICKKINIKSPLKSLPENSAWSKNTTSKQKPYSSLCLFILTHWLLKENIIEIQKRRNQWNQS